MAKNRGKDFEGCIQEAFEQVEGVSIDRVHDQTTLYKGSSNTCDFIVYKQPYEYYFECKSTRGNTLSIHSNNPEQPYGAIRKKQWEGLLEKSKIEGVFAGVICWFIDHDVTVFVPIQMLQDLRELGYKSLNINGDWQEYYGKDWNWHWLDGEKKRVYFNYNAGKLLEDINFMHENY